MKSVLTVLAVMLFSISMVAQRPEPTFERVGDMVKGIFYHDNGQIAQVGCFKDGKLQGEWVTFDKNGTKISLGHYNQGKRTGKWVFWRPDGEAMREVSYRDGKLLSVVEWSKRPVL